MKECSKGLQDALKLEHTKTGRWFGREEKTIEDSLKDFKKYYLKMINKELSKVEMAKLLGVGRATLVFN